MSTAFDLRTDGTSAPATSSRAPAVITKRFTASVNGLVAGDTTKLFNIPAGSVVLAVITKVITAETGSSTRTFSVGDSGAAGAYLTGANAKATAGVVTIGDGSTGAVTAGATAVAKPYAAADYIMVTAVEALTNAVIDVTAVIVPA